jgi:hypothetical protein
LVGEPRALASAAQRRAIDEYLFARSHRGLHLLELGHVCGDGDNFLAPTVDATGLNIRARHLEFGLVARDYGHSRGSLHARGGQ